MNLPYHQLWTSEANAWFRRAVALRSREKKLRQKGRVSVKKSLSISKLISYCIVLSTPLSCVTPQEERQIKEDIARLQTQVVRMQNDVQSNDKSLKARLIGVQLALQIERISVDTEDHGGTRCFKSRSCYRQNAWTTR